MLLPIGPDVMQQMQPVPEVVKNRHVYGWYCMVLLLIAVGCAEAVGGAVMAAFFFFFLAGIFVYLVLDSCKNMSMYCLLLVGIMAGFQSIFELMSLLAVINGRTNETTTMKGGDVNKGDSGTQEITYITKVTVHPLFDRSMGQKYNVQSGAIVASPIVLILCTLLCYISYNSYSSSLFEDDEEAGPINGGYGRGYGGYAPQSGRQAQSQRQATQQTRIFEGAGQRLGS
eukprot:TRINITY_DN4126_c0_g3_i1.p1 TRINITY_DN4126_c0_g3~~TRINITY_DN4126_c0_g3_i1.p1  ORF type:complete len:228 (-),score=34.19 TRINITY_DN4126_c0_g3_i1:195-878(-)